jgi:hypothetical protein
MIMAAGTTLTQGGAAGGARTSAPGAAPVTAGSPGAIAAPGAPAGATPLAALSIRELRARRDEISRQLSNVASRRGELVSQLRDAAPGVDRAGIESRVATLDARILEMETDLAITGRLLQAAQGTAATIDQPPPPGRDMPSSGQMTAIAIVFMLAVLMPLTVAWGRAILRRTARASAEPSPQLLQRLDRMEQGIEAIAIEVERISEGQRFVSKLLGEGAAPPVAIARGERVPAARDG